MKDPHHIRTKRKQIAAPENNDLILQMRYLIPQNELVENCWLTVALWSFLNTGKDKPLLSLKGVINDRLPYEDLKRPGIAAICTRL